jgi:hypothetical protein
MGGQAIERREILRYIGMASVAASFPGFSRWAFACDHNSSPLIAAMATTPAKPYQPLFFTAEQFQMVEHLTEIIIPEDDTPGAKKAGVAEFIDFMLANRVPVSSSREVRSTQDAIEIGQESQNRFLAGLAWLDARSHGEFRHTFMECTPEQQNGLLEEIAYKAKFKPGAESGQSFFWFLREYTVVGYYTTKIGLQSLGYPGLRQIWDKLPGCSHPDDPAHARLPPSTSSNLA